MVALGAIVLAGGSAAQAHTGRESRVQQRLTAIAHDPIQLRQFMLELPKGADLHNHLSGAVFAESFLQWAAQDGTCITKVTYVASLPPCTADQFSASTIMTNTGTQSEIINAWSMRSFVPSLTVSGHDHFFATFGRFGGVLGAPGRTGDALAQVLDQAGRDHTLRLETMITPNSGGAFTLAGALDARDPSLATDPGNFAEALALLRASGLDGAVADAKSQTDDFVGRAQQDLACGTAAAQPGCSVQYGFLAQSNRNARPNAVFTQFALAFALASVDPRWSGIQLVAPEDGLISLRDYTLQMRMVRYLSQQYPGVKIALHAGEFVPGLVPPADLTSHIRQAVVIAGASRIGHGVSIRNERDADQLMKVMRARGVTVEVALTSNQQILDVTARNSQFPVYEQAGVPRVLATDDPGVERTDLPAQYAKAFAWFKLDYQDLKKLSYASADASFLNPFKRAHLKQDLDIAFAAFEKKWAKSAAS